MAELNADFSRVAVMRTTAMDWQESPGAGVLRKRLELRGPVECGRVTSVVRYRPGSRFPAHGHPGGEEILVLDGVFSDETGDYPAGSYLLNPEGFTHAPRSSEGCTLFVKLRQYAGTRRRPLRLASHEQPPRAGSPPGVSMSTLYEDQGFPERVDLVRLAAEAALPPPGAGGLEVFVLDGACHDGERPLAGGDWARYPPGARPALHGTGGCSLYLKTGHLRELCASTGF